MIIITVPHTSNWDFVYNIATQYSLGIKVNWVGKKALFKWPFRLIMCHLLGIEISNWWKFRFPLASVTVMDVHKEGSSLCLFGDVSYLT